MLKRNVRVLVLVASILILVAVTAVTQTQQQNTLLGAQLASKEQIEQITQIGAASDQDCELYWNDVRLPYNAQMEAYCLPQTLTDTSTGSLSAQWGNLYLPDWEWQSDWSEKMENGTTMPVYVSDGSQWKKIQVYVSGMPVIAIDSQVRVSTPRDMTVYGYTMGKLPVENNYGSIRVFWPDGDIRRQVITTGVEWHWRGNASYFADKKSYRINLMDSDGNADRKDLLGLGENSDWILLNLATDVTRVKDKVSNDLWNQLSDQYDYDMPGAETEFVELYLNDQYMGVYLLCSPVEKRSLNLTNKDKLYKLRQAAWLTDEEFDKLTSDESLEWLNKFEVVYPKRWSEGVWDPLVNYLKLLYQPQESPTWEQIEQTVQIDNLLDVALFKQFTCAIDNVFQNQYVAYLAEDGLCYRVPWDMNYTWGDAYEGVMEQDLSTYIIKDYELDTLCQADLQQAQTRIAERWQQLRQTVFDVDKVLDAMQQQTDYLIESGAMKRDFALWGEKGGYASGLSDYQTLNLEQVEKLLKKRTAYLDQYMQKYTPLQEETSGEVS